MDKKSFYVFADFKEFERVYAYVAQHDFAIDYNKHIRDNKDGKIYGFSIPIWRDACNWSLSVEPASRLEIILDRYNADQNDSRSLQK